MPEFQFTGVLATQSTDHSVVSFSATASDIISFAMIDRVGRDEKGVLHGFQRPQIASHIQEIRDYLQKDNAVLPNPIVVAFTDSVEIISGTDGTAAIKIAFDGEPPGVVVDGQQRLSALLGLDRPDFQVFVSALICPNVEELRRQFILINNTRPLPKSLIYELLPSVQGLPARLTARSFAASLTERLNFDTQSTLFGQISQHTNPVGVLRDTAIQRVIMNSASNGALRDFMHFPEGEEKSFHLISDFFGAVQQTFPDEWHGHKPKTSRLVHASGIVAMSYVMELLHTRDGSQTQADFVSGLSCLHGQTAWTRGSWTFSEDNIQPWNAIQFVNRDVVRLADYLIRVVKRAGKQRIHLVTGHAGGVA